MTSWKVLHDKIIVKRDPEKTVTKIAGLEVPDQAREKPNRGEVVAVGQGRITPGALLPQPLALTVGNIVLFNKFAGVPLDEDEDPDLIVLREDEILAYQ